MKAYLFTYSNLVSPETARATLDSTSAVSTWVSPFPYAAIVLSNLTVSELTAVLSVHFPDVWFVVVELTKDNCNGLLPVQLWDYVTNPFEAWSKRIFAKFAVPSPPPKFPELPPVPDFIARPPRKKS